MKRPVLWALAFLCAGIASGLTGADYGGWFPILMFSAAALSAAAICFAYRWPPAAVFFICFICGFLRVGQSLGSDPAVSQWVNDGETLRMTGYVLESKLTQTGRARAVFDVYLIESGKIRHPARMRIMAVLPENMSAEAGSGMILRGALVNLDKARNPGAFDEFYYYRARKIQYKCFPDIEGIFGQNAQPLNRALSKWRQRLAGVYESVLPPEEASVIKAVVLGDESGLEDSTAQLYRTVGIYHILSVSGLHISIISLIIYRLLGVFLDKRRAGAINLALLIFYCLFTGSAIPTVRSVFMAGIIITGEIMFRDRDMRSSIGFAAACMLIYEPLYICDIGFQLSFSAVFAITVLAEPVDRLLSRLVIIPRILRAAASGNLAAILGTLPCMLFHFYVITPYAFFANLVILPTSSALIVMGVITGGLGIFWQNASEFAAGILFIILRFYRAVCEFFRRMPGAEILTGCPGLWLTLIIALAILLFAYWFSAAPGQMKKRGYIFFTTLGICAFIAVYRYYPPAFEVTMLDVDQSEAFIIRQNRHVYVIDGGGLPNAPPGRDTGTRVVVPYLNYLGVSRIDGVFVSHTDHDHAGGVIELLPQKKVECLYFSYTVDRGSAIYNILAESCGQLKIPVIYLSKGDMIKTEGMRINIIYPSRGDAGAGNEACLVTQFFCNGASVLFTGDIDSAVEKRLEFASPTVLKLSHHGSKYSNDEGFLRAASPRIAIVSAGRRNIYGFPAPETVGRLRSLNIPLYNTADAGAVTLAFNNGRFSVKTTVKREAP